MFLDLEWKDLGALGGVTMFTLAVGGLAGFILIAWLKTRLKGVFVEHTDLALVQSKVDGVKADVGAVKADVQALTQRTVDLEEQVAALPTKEDVKTIRHDVKDLLQQNAALGAFSKAQGEMMGGIDRRLEMIMDKLMETPK